MAFTTILTLDSYNGEAPLVFEVESFSFDEEQTLNIGSQSSGSGAGKITFNPFTVTRFPDKWSPRLFLHCASGAAFKTAALTVTPDGAAVPYITYLMKLAAIKNFAAGGNQHGGPLPLETVSFEYGGFSVIYGDPSQGNATIGGWNRIRNVEDPNPGTVIK